MTTKITKPLGNKQKGYRHLQYLPNKKTCRADGP